MRALAVLLFALLALAAPARADVKSAADALAGDPVYVDPSAELADQVDADALRARIKSAGAAPLYIAVLPASDQTGSAGRTLIALRQATGRKGTYALAVGNDFRTLGDGFNAAAAGQTARSAHPNDLQATLEQFIDAAGKAQDDAGAGGSGAGALIAVVLLLVVVGGGAALVISRRRARGEGGEDGVSEVGHIEQNDEFVRLGDSIRALELDVTLGDPNPAAKADYDRAVEAYARANEYNAKGATTAADRALDEGLAAIASARERLAGRR
ncbi:hypothetical protein [Solirubrobacter soli]|uniref:hypothetical protein n=1 Tax=Solirubrobacter soli TaxID=363832 RepID=UPI0004257B00|nr:hypothetical protein [Solirubrobacter soli]